MNRPGSRRNPAFSEKYIAAKTRAAAQDLTQGFFARLQKKVRDQPNQCEMNSPVSNQRR